MKYYLKEYDNGTGPEGVKIQRGKLGSLFFEAPARSELDPASPIESWFIARPKMKKAFEAGAPAPVAAPATTEEDILAFAAAEEESVKVPSAEEIRIGDLAARITNNGAAKYNGIRKHRAA